MNDNVKTEVHLKDKASVYTRESPREVHDLVEEAMVAAKAFVTFHDGHGEEMFIDPRLVVQIMGYEPRETPASSPRRRWAEGPM